MRPTLATMVPGGWMCGERMADVFYGQCACTLFSTIAAPMLLEQQLKSSGFSSPASKEGIRFSSTGAEVLSPERTTGLSPGWHGTIHSVATRLKIE